MLVGCPSVLSVPYTGFQCRQGFCDPESLVVWWHVFPVPVVGECDNLGVFVADDNIHAMVSFLVSLLVFMLGVWLIVVDNCLVIDGCASTVSPCLPIG